MTDEMWARKPLAPRMNGDDLRGGSGAPASLPLAGRVVAIVHPAWHSCGSHQVFVSQARAYRSLGAKVMDEWALLRMNNHEVRNLVAAKVKVGA